MMVVVLSDNDEVTPILMAAMCGHCAIVKYLSRLLSHKVCLFCSLTNHTPTPTLLPSYSSLFNSRCAAAAMQLQTL
jgi:hypothetical protein